MPERLDKAFGRGNFYLELQDHGLRDDPVVCDGIKNLSEKTGIPMVATNDVHYIKKSDARKLRLSFSVSRQTTS